MNSNPTWSDLQLRKNPYPGKLIVLEGIDGAGKTTQAHILVDRLVQSGHNAMYTKEPTDTIIGTFIREKILSGNEKINHLALQYLFNADRAQHMEEIEQHLQTGRIVVMDRYFWSSVAYAMSDMQKPMDWYYTAFSILSFYHQFLVPDVTFFLKITPERAYERIEKSKKHNEIYDTKEYLEKIEENYQHLMQEFPQAFTSVDAERSSEEIADDLYSRITTLIK